MRPQLAPRDVRLAEIAARQHGVVSVARLRALGFDSCAVTRRVRTGRLHRVHRGVYAVGHAGISREGRWLAAVLAGGLGAALSHSSAAAFWGLLRPIPGPVHVTVPTHGGRATQAGIRLHRCASLANPALIVVGNRIAVTTVARTIADIRASLPSHLYRRAVRQAEIAGYALGPGVVADRARSDFEGRFLQLCRRAGVPAPEVNVRVGQWTVDFLWPARRLAVETDSYTFHRGSIAFEDDHARDLDLRARGYEVRRFTEHQVFKEANRVIADLQAAIERRP